MRRLLLVLGPIALAALWLLPASAVNVDFVIWQFNRDYPGSRASDTGLPIRTIYIKTHDGKDWMSTYDSHPVAVSGPDSLRNLINVYRSQGIQVAAWFVPKGPNIEQQLLMAKQVLDTGVVALYADIEPFLGFCNQDCPYLADTFWRRLRGERPSARLGVIYDPRTQMWGPSGTSTWLSLADEAQPMCYWETYAGQPPWDNPAGCVLQAYLDLVRFLPGKPLTYLPMLQGATSPDLFNAGQDAALAVTAAGVSVWRRGVVPGDLWPAIASYNPATRPCWTRRADGCLVKGASQPFVYLLQAGARFHVPDPPALVRMGLERNTIHTTVDQFISLLPTVPPEDTILSEEGALPYWVVKAGSRFAISSPDALPSLGLNPANIKRIPRGSVTQIPQLPAPYTLLKELSDNTLYAIVASGRVALTPQMFTALQASGYGQQFFTVPDGSLTPITLNQPRRGDVSCDGLIDSVDALHVLQTVAGVPNLGICTSPQADVDCSGQLQSVDSLFILRSVAGLSVSLPTGCPLVGSVISGSAVAAATTDPSAAESPSPAPSENVADPETGPPTETSSPADAVTATATPSATITATPTATHIPSPSRRTTPAGTPSTSPSPNPIGSSTPTSTARR